MEPNMRGDRIDTSRQEKQPGARLRRRDVLGGSAALLAGSIAGSLSTGLTCTGARAATATPDKPVAIEYWIGVGVDSSKAYQAILADFRRAHPNFDVKLNNYSDYGPLNTALQAAIAGRKPPALAEIGFDLIRYTAAFLPHIGVEDAAKAAGEDGSTFLSDNFSQKILALGQVGGVQHLLPQLIGSPYLFYNQDAFARAGIERPPATWPDLRECARRITAKTGRPCFSIPEKGYFWAYQALIESNGALLLTQGRDRYGTQLGDPAAIEAMQLMADMVLRDKTALYLGDAQAGADYQNGDLPMITGFSSQVVGAVKAGRFKVGTAPLPGWPGKPKRIPVAGSGFMFFDVGEAERGAAWTLAKFMCEPAAQTMFTKGTGYPPTRLGVADNPTYLGSFYKDNPLFGPDIAQLDSVVPWISFPGQNGPQASKVLDETRDRIFAGQDVASVLQSSAKQISELINT